MMSDDSLDTNKEEDIATIINKLLFKGDWQKQLAWTRKHGSEKDTEVVKKGMGKMMKSTRG